MANSLYYLLFKTAHTQRKKNKRNYSEENKRNVYIQLTELGKITFLKWQAYLDEREDITLRDFSKEERKQFINYLKRLYDALLKEE